MTCEEMSKKYKCKITKSEPNFITGLILVKFSFDIGMVFDYVIRKQEMVEFGQGYVEDIICQIAIAKYLDVIETFLHGQDGTHTNAVYCDENANIGKDDEK